MLSEFTDRQAANADLYELEDVETGQKRQYRIVSKATVTVPGTDLNKMCIRDRPRRRLIVPERSARTRINLPEPLVKP